MYFIKFKLSTNIEQNKVMVIPANSKQEAADMAFQAYGEAVDKIYSKSELFGTLQTIAWLSPVIYTQINNSTGEVKSIIEYPIKVDTNNVVNSILNWFKLASNNKINFSNKEINAQYACFIEEFTETFESILSKNDVEIIQKLKEFKDKVNSNDVVKWNDLTKEQRINLADGLGDVIVTALGLGYRLGFKMEDILKEISKSNHSKFEKGKPLYNADGKIIKGSNYVKPDLSKFI